MKIALSILIIFFTYCPTYGQWVKTSLEIELFNSPALETKGDTLILVNTQPIIYRSFNSGTTWEILNNSFPQTKQIEDIEVSGSYLIVPAWHTNPDSVKHGVYRSTDNGLTWVLPSGNGKSQFGIFKLYSNGPYLYGLHKDGVVCKSTDNGNDWTCWGSGLSGGSLTGISSIDSYLYTSTLVDGIFRSSNNGEKWEMPELIGLSVPIYTIGSYGSALSALSNSFYHSTDKGAHWSEHKQSNDFAPRTMLTHGKYIFAGSWGVDGAIYYSVDTGETWTNFSGNLGTEKVLFIESNDQYIFIGLQSGVWRRHLSDLAVTEKEANSHALSAYPNPATKELTISHTSGRAKQVVMYNMTGALIRSGVVHRVTTWDVSALPSGSYMLGIPGEVMQIMQVVH